jgi:hypothetical protein
MSFDPPSDKTHCHAPPPSSPSSRAKWHAAIGSARPRASSDNSHASMKLAEQQQTSTHVFTASASASTASSKKWFAAIDGTLKAHGHASCVPTSAKSILESSSTSTTTSPPAARPPCSEIKRAHLADIQSARMALAALLRDRGEYDRALPIYEECWAERKEFLGDDHPLTLLVTNAVAFTLHLQGNYRRALPLLEESLEAWRELHGEQHPNTVRYQARRDDCIRLLAESTQPRSSRGAAASHQTS